MKDIILHEVLCLLLRITSDVHLEQFMHQTVPVGVNWAEYLVPTKDQDAESILILAGDICEFQYVTHFANAFKTIAQRFKAVIWVPGNHEYCGSPAISIGRETFFYYKELLRRYGNIHLLDNCSVTVEGIKFYGATLWTNYNDSPIAANICAGMWDFRHGRVTPTGEATRATRPADYVTLHENAKAKLVSQLARKEELVVISHFAPSHQSMHQKYKNQTPFEINYHFVNNLDSIIEESPEIKLWIHGHTHTQFDYVVGQTRVICNPKGFPDEDTCRIGDLDYIEV